MNTSYLNEMGLKIERELLDRGLYRKIEYPETTLEDGKITTSYSFPIKAFEKFLGYFDFQQNIAFNPSVSFNTDFSLTMSSCIYLEKQNRDRVILDSEESETYSKKALKALNIFKKDHNIPGSFVFYIERLKKYGNAKGMSESSAVASSVSRSLVDNVFRETEFRSEIVSRYARLVSGSGTRAAVDGISIWLSYPGIDIDQSFAVRVRDNPSRLYYGIFPKFSAIKTDNAHRAIVNSVFYETWLKDKYNAILQMLSDNFSIEGLIRRGQVDSLNMHGILMSIGSSPQTPESIATLKKLLEFQKKNEGIYINADTGPSIMISSLDRSLINECVKNVGEPFIEGGKSGSSLLNERNGFEKRSNEFLSNY